MADSPCFTETGEAKLYSKSSPRSRAFAQAAIDDSRIASADSNLSARNPLAAAAWARNSIAAFAGAAGAIDPGKTTGPTGRFSASSAPGRCTYLGSYNCVMKEIGRPETTDN